MRYTLKISGFGGNLYLRMCVCVAAAVNAITMRKLLWRTV